MEWALEERLEQIRTRDYAAELRANEADPRDAFAVAFDDKGVRTRGVTPKNLREVQANACEGL